MIEHESSKSDSLEESDELYTVKVICSYCQKEMGEKVAQLPHPSHSVCRECYAEQFPGKIYPEPKAE